MWRHEGEEYTTSRGRAVATEVVDEVKKERRDYLFSRYNYSLESVTFRLLQSASVQFGLSSRPWTASWGNSPHSDVEWSPIIYAPIPWALTLNSPFPQLAADPPPPPHPARPAK